LRTLIETIGGGAPSGRPIAAAVVGGPSGSVVPPRDFDEPLIPRSRVNPGTGGIVALDDAAFVRDAVRTLIAFNARESCGKCTPCREGTARMLALLDETKVDATRVRTLAETVQLASLCGLGQAAPLAVLSGLAEFPREFGVS
jgi:NADH:ubiquinone oxidoreductase subunit F (NADH-binding)